MNKDQEAQEWRELYMRVFPSYGPWHVIMRFRDGSEHRRRMIPGGIEERIFNPDGTLRPLPDGKTSPADDPSTHVR